MQMYNCRCGLSQSLEGHIKLERAAKLTAKLTSHVQTLDNNIRPSTFCVLEIKWFWWCRRGNNPETFDGSLLLSVRTLDFVDWVELSCHVRFSPTLVSPAGEWPRKVPSFPVGDSTTPPGNQDGLWNPWRLVWNRSTAATDAPQHFSSSLFWVVDSYSLHFNFDVAIDGKKARAK